MPEGECSYIKSLLLSFNLRKIVLREKQDQQDNNNKLKNKENKQNSSYYTQDC